MEPAKLAPEASKQAAIIPPLYDATRKTYLLDSSRFMTDSDEGIGILPSQRQTADPLQPTLNTQHLLVDTRVPKSQDESESEYQTSSIGKSPIATTLGTLSTEKTSPFLSIAQVTSDPDPLDLESQRNDEEIARQLENRISLLNFSDQRSTVSIVDDSNQTQRQDEASVLQGSGGWASNQDDGLNEQLYHVFADMGFLPENLLSDLINQAAVLTQLTKTLPRNLQPYVQKYVDIICKDSDFQDAEECPVSYRKIFAILALVEKTGAIPMLIDEGVDDAKLPLVVFKREGKFELGYKKIDPTGGVSIELLHCFKDWTRQKKDEFRHYQWSMLAPVFEEGKYNLVRHYVIYHQNQLPFIHQDDTTQDSEYDGSNDEGGGGRVTMVNIHPHHHRFTNEALSKRGYAVKALHNPSRKVFERERDILSKFKGHNEHENIVSLLATYELDYKSRHKFNMIFYRADGNLFDYWREANPSPSFSHETMLWGSGQCKSLAHGLLQLHAHTTWPISESEGINQFGRHGDIKPKNILYYPKPGCAHPTLVICDFGVSELRFRITGSAKDDALTLSYRAPECDIEGKSPGRPADIWSLGCVYLEFVAWLLGGFPLVHQFTNRRLSYDMRLMSLTLKTDAFFENDEARGRRVKDAVTQAIAEFHSSPQCTQYLHDFLELIEHGMLVMDPEGRVKCLQLYEQLNSIFAKCQESEDYAMKAVPEPATATLFFSYGELSNKSSNDRGKFYDSQGISERIGSKPIPQWQSIHTPMSDRTK
ncbi:kinase-like domain-containing protein [Nemania sp. FL0031]|nr:kinase-like domain-containing protein [Nemania sp. FL0031]